MATAVCGSLQARSSASTFSSLQTEAPCGTVAATKRTRRCYQTNAMPIISFGQASPVD
jgi:hypothetical protein